LYANLPKQTAPLIDAYSALIEITKENGKVEKPSDPGAIKERQYRDDYLDENVNSPKSTAMRKRILEGSRQFLEKQ
jgi:nuclear pore complex protein Nup93